MTTEKAMRQAWADKDRAVILQYLRNGLVPGGYWAIYTAKMGGGGIRLEERVTGNRSKAVERATELASATHQ